MSLNVRADVPLAGTSGSEPISPSSDQSTSLDATPGTSFDTTLEIDRLFPGEQERANSSAVTRIELSCKREVLIDDLGRRAPRLRRRSRRRGRRRGPSVWVHDSGRVRTLV